MALRRSGGGPPHQDMVDLKPDAPAEVRGEFRPMTASGPGIPISELIPMVADLHERGLDHDMSVVVWGESGRTPLINASAG